MASVSFAPTQLSDAARLDVLAQDCYAVMQCELYKAYLADALGSALHVTCV